MKFRSTAISAIFLTAALILAAPGHAFAADGERIDALELQMQKLRDENANLHKRVDDVEIADEETKQIVMDVANLVNVSGYADVEYKLTNQPEQNNKFRIHHLSLFFSKNVDKDWRVFSEIEYEDAPRIESNNTADTVNKSQGLIFVEQMYLQYHPQFDWDVRLGRFLTPYGYWSIYHYSPYVPTQTYPLFFKVMFPEVSDGLQLRKSVPMGDMTLDTHLYVANGSGNSGNGDRNNNKGAGLRLNLDIISGLSVGTSYYREKDNFDSMNATYGAHLVLTHKSIRILSEYFKRQNKPHSVAAFNDNSWYGQLTYDIDKWTIAGRYDWYDASNKITNNSRYRYTGAINYHFAHNVTGKAEYSRNTFDDPLQKDYSEAIFSIVAAIGDL